MKFFEGELKKVGLHIAGKTGAYPPSSVANIPQPSTPGAKWYQRGSGPKWANVGKRGGRFRRTSENLGKKWKVTPKRLSVTIANPVTYAQYVHGKKQARFHKRRGWLRLDEVDRKETPHITRALQNAVKREIRR